MDTMLSRMCRRYCSRTLMIIRNEESRVALRKLGLSSHVGADTAWTFQPLDVKFGETTLRSAGWDGSQSVLATCRTNRSGGPLAPHC